MADSTRKEVDLVIRAKDMSQKVLKDNEAAISEVTSALEEQGKVAQKTGASVDELQSGLKALSKTEADLSKNQTALDKAMSQTATSMDRAVGREQALAASMQKLNQELTDQEKKARGAAGAYELFAQDILSVGPPTRQAAKDLAAFSTSADKIDKGVDDLRGKMAGLSSAMYSARAATAELAGIQQRLTVAQQQTAAASQQASAAIAAQKTQIASVAAANAAAAAAARQAATEAKRAQEAEAEARNKNTASLQNLLKGQRESLSWYQRLRGEVIALATAYIGVQGAIGVAKDALDAFQKRQSSENVLSVVVGTTDTKKVGDEMEYVRGVADKLGFRFLDLTQQYGKFAVAAKAAGASSDEIRFIFENLTKVTRSLNLNAEDTKGVFLAVQQMFSKGKISAEELRQQLAERIPGATAILAKSMGVTTAQLDKMMEKGQVGADKIMGLTKAMADEFSKGLPGSIQSLNAEMGRFQTALDDFKLTIADAGFAKAFTAFLQKLTAFFKSSDGQEFAKSLSVAFSKVLDVLSFLIDNLTTVKNVLTLIVGLKAVQWFVSLAAGAVQSAQAMGTLVTALSATGPAATTAAGGMTTATAAATGLSKSLLGLQRAALLVVAAFAGWELGKILEDQFVGVRIFGVAAAEGIMEAWIKIKTGIVILAADMTLAVSEWFDKGLRSIGELKNGFLGGLSDAAKKLGLESLGNYLAGGITAAVKTGLEDSVSMAKKAAADARADQAKQLALNKAIADEQYRQALSRDRVRLANTKSTQPDTKAPGKSSITVAPPDNSKEIAKREKLEEALSDKLNALEKKNEKNTKDSLDERVSAVQRAFKDIEDTVAKFQKHGGTEVDGVPLEQFKQKIAATKQVAIEQETLKFNTEAITKAEKTVNDLIAERKDRVAAVNQEYKDGAITASEAFQKVESINAELVPVINMAADGAARFAQNLKGTPGMNDNKLDALIAKMQKISAVGTVGGASANAKDGIDLFNAGMKEANDLLQQRNATVATYNQLVELGAMQQSEANQKIKEAYAATQPQISKAIDAMRQLLTDMATSGNIKPEKLEALNAQLTLLDQNAKYVDQDMVRIKNAFESTFNSGFQDTVNAMGDAIVGLARGTMSWGDAWKSVGTVALKALGNIAQAVANAITQMIALKIASSILNLFGPVAPGSGVEGNAGFIGPPSSARVSHEGGIIGSGLGNRSRPVAASWFANAPRYHSGTIVGLRSDEQAAILQKGEEVLSKDNPRNILNQNLAATREGFAKQPNSIRNVLVMDDNLIPDALQSSQGEQTLVTVIGRNKGKVRKILGL